LQPRPPTDEKHPWRISLSPPPAIEHPGPKAGSFPALQRASGVRIRLRRPDGRRNSPVRKSSLWLAGRPSGPRLRPLRRFCECPDHWRRQDSRSDLLGRLALAHAVHEQAASLAARAAQPVNARLRTGDYCRRGSTTALAPFRAAEGRCRTVSSGPVPIDNRDRSRSRPGGSGRRPGRGRYPLG